MNEHDPSSRHGWLSALGRALGFGGRARHGHVVHEAIAGFPSAELEGDRPIDLYLPPGYAESHDYYPVLYALDGQDLAQWRLRDTLEGLIGGGLISPCVVIGVHTGPNRLQEYGIAGHPNSIGLGTQAAAHARFITDELMPFIETYVRVKRGPGQTAIMGASLGGLAAFDLAWHRSDRFGAVGVFSGSFWWRSEDGSVEAMQRSRIMHRLVRAAGHRPRLRCWFQAGTRDEDSDRDGNGVIDAIQDTTELIDEMVARGYRRGPDLVYRQVEGGEHNQETWAMALPEFLRFLHGR